MNESFLTGTSCPPCESAQKIASDAVKPALGTDSSAPCEVALSPICAESASPIAPENPPVLLAGSVPSTARPFRSDYKDALFALIFFAVGFCYIYIFTSASLLLNFTLFAVVYLSAVLCYAYARGVKPTRASWFWFAITLLCGLSFCLVSNDSFAGFQFLFLTAAAVYWTLSVFGVTEPESSGNFIPLDFLRGFIVLPFGNFFAGLHSICRTLFCKHKIHQPGGVLFGLLLACPLLWFFILPLLLRADAGFDALFARFVNALLPNGDIPLLFLLRCALALPVSAYLFGLVYGAARKCHSDLPRRTGLQSCGNTLRCLSESTVCTVLGAVCLVYFFFITVQSSYLFSAFRGIRPAEFTYADYARSGFFELCRIVSFNLMLLIAGTLLCRTPRANARAVRAASSLLSVLTLCLIATALSKMLLYISAYGLTPKRVLASLALIFLALVFVLLLFWQKKAIPLMRIAVIVFTVGFTALCLFPLDRAIQSYNDTYGYHEIAPPAEQPPFAA